MPEICGLRYLLNAESRDEWTLRTGSIRQMGEELDSDNDHYEPLVHLGVNRAFFLALYIYYSTSRGEARGSRQM